MEKQVHITFDYELFFGSASGTVDRCMIEPSELLRELAFKHHVKFVFFVDAGFLHRLKSYRHIPACARDFDLVATQLRFLNLSGHEIALHVHPHWEDCTFESGRWKINTTRYKLSDFSEAEIKSIISKYHDTLTEIVGKPCTSFRAGGWCIQPFSKIREALGENKIFTDSSVYRNGYHQFTAQSYDFRNAPDKEVWKFSDNECAEDPNGAFTEIAITPDKISPLFYFNLYLKMRSNPAWYKPMGDGSWLKDKKKIYKQFYSFTNHFATCDGYFASRLKSILLETEAKGKNRMCVLAHPKSMAACSFQYIEEFIIFAQSKGYRFATLHEAAKK
jgi:peptidoglycan/xylan/chitin deacetylase (PgdA/CDA1 family)